ncbi:MAG: HNH endonuclease [Chloroflexota bacterium]
MANIFQLDEFHRDVSDDELLYDLLQVADSLGRKTVTWEEYRKHGKYNSSTLTRRFGLWFKALEAAGLERTTQHPPLINFSDDKLLYDLSQVANSLGKREVTISEYEIHGKFNSSTLRRRFGSWFKALEAAGLERTTQNPLRISDEELFDNLEQVWRTLGRQPRHDEMRGPSKYAAETYVKRFGSWRKALERFVAFMNQEEPPVSREAPLNQYNPAIQPENEENNSGGNLKVQPQRVIRERKDATVNPVGLRLRWRVMNRDHFKCVADGKSPSQDPNVILHVDHIIPRSKGGLSIMENLQTLCQDCNLGKSNLII